MKLLAIDPGPEGSALLLYDTEAKVPIRWGKYANTKALLILRSWEADDLAIEMIASYGLAVGQETFETCVVIGRFIERWHAPCTRIFRRDVKLHLCGAARAKDANVRQALIDRYGGKSKAIGLKATPGPLYKLSGDCWAALGVAITASEVPLPLDTAA